MGGCDEASIGVVVLECRGPRFVAFLRPLLEFQGAKGAGRCLVDIDRDEAHFAPWGGLGAVDGWGKGACVSLGHCLAIR